jgi:uncharacterized protein YycO
MHGHHHCQQVNNKQIVNTMKQKFLFKVRVLERTSAQTTTKFYSVISDNKQEAINWALSQTDNKDAKAFVKRRKIELL